MARSLSLLKRKRFWIGTAFLLFVIFAVVFFFRKSETSSLGNIPSSPGKEDNTPPVTAIVSPEDKSWHSSGFSVVIEDVDSDSGLVDFVPQKQGCEYLIEDVGTGLAREGFRPCGETQIFISVGEGAVCSSSFQENSFQGRCVVSTRARDKAGNVSGWESTVFYVDFKPPTLTKVDTPKILFPSQEHTLEATVADEGRVDGCNLFVNGQSTGMFPILSPIPCQGGDSCAISSFVLLESPGDYTVFFACVDSAGNVGRGEEAPFRVFINRVPFISSCRVVPAEGNIDTPFLFSVQAQDPDGDELSFRWDFGDGVQSTEPNSTHQYLDLGVYVPRVTVQDASEKLVSCQTAWVVVEE